MKPWAVLVVNRMPATKMISVVLQLNVILTKPEHRQASVGIHPVVSVALTSNLGQQVEFRAGGHLGAEK